jgi:hypothetical protein
VKEEELGLPSFEKLTEKMSNQSNLNSTEGMPATPDSIQ